MQQVATFILLVCMSSLFSAQEDDAAAALERARVSFDAASTEFNVSVLKWFSTQEDRARAKGDRKALTTLKIQRVEYSRSGKIPNIAPKSLRRKQEQIHLKMEAAYLQAIRDFTRVGNDQLAAQTEKQLDDFRKRSVTMSDRKVWRHAGGSFALAANEVWEEKISDGRSFRYEEIDRNEEYIELVALTGDTNVHIRLYENHAESGLKPNLVFKKHLKGNWEKE